MPAEKLGVERLASTLREWRTVSVCPAYEVNGFGVVRRKDSGKIISQSLSIKGYLRVCMSMGSLRVTRTVHSLVATAFLGDRPHGMHICHWDGNKKNACALNLRYATAKDNAADQARLGRAAIGDRNGMRTKPARRPRGERHGSHVLTVQDVRPIRSRLKDAKKGDIRSLAKQFGVSDASIRDVRDGVTWSHV